MIHQPPNDREALVAYVVGLSIACPVAQDNPPECPLNPLRHQPLQARYDRVKSLDDRRLREIAAHHCSCLAQKEALLHRS